MAFVVRIGKTWLLPNVLGASTCSSNQRCSNSACTPSRRHAFLMNATPSNASDPPPESSENVTPKKKRGRPKGSKNKPDSAYQLYSTPKMLALNARLSVSRNRPNGVNAFDSTTQMRALNGLASGPEDLLPEILPILASQQVDEDPQEPEHETLVRDTLREISGHLSSHHRFNTKHKNLKPFKLQKETTPCDACAGTGFTVCSYCHGEGFVDLGPDAETFYKDFPNNMLKLPKHVMGDTYHCPMCGGLQRERCQTCLGFAHITEEFDRDAIIDGAEYADVVYAEDNERAAGASRTPMRDPYVRALDLESLLSEAGDRVEHTKDGNIIIRAKKKTRRKTKLSSTEGTEATSGDGATPVKRKRGRPRKYPLETKEEKTTVATDREMEATNSPAPVKRKRGRPRKTAPLDAPPFEAAEEGLEVEPLIIGTPMPDGAPGGASDSELVSVSASDRPTTQPGKLSKPVGRSTDFVNTTDYKVGRRLRKQKRNLSRSSAKQNISTTDGDSETNKRQRMPRT